MARYNAPLEIHVHGQVTLRGDVTFENLQDALKPLWKYAGSRSLKDASGSFYEDEPGIKFEEGFRADLLVDDKVILELKSVEVLHNAHKKQLLTYLKLTGMKLGYLLNFGEELMKDGICRVVNGYVD